MCNIINMKKSLFITLLTIPALFGTSCKDEIRQVNVYRKKGIVDKTISVRFFKDSPNVPYISVPDFYKEFFDTEVTKMHGFKTRFDYFYMSPAKEFLCFSTNFDTFQTIGFSSFDNNPNYSTSTGKLYIKFDKAEATDRQVKEIDLTKYGMKLYSRQKEAYVPLTLLSDISGGLSGIDIAYNGKDVYFFDYQGLLGDATNPATFGSEYISVLGNTNESRKPDLANFSYNELCLVFDNFRGHTKQLVFGDDKLESLGLDKLLSTYHPKIKEYLLSVDKMKYYEGLTALFNGLDDGGHTGLTLSFKALEDAASRNSEEDFVTLKNVTEQHRLNYTGSRTSFLNSRKNVFDVEITDRQYYFYSPEYKTAFIGFNGFYLDVAGWDNFYNGKGEVPVETDTYAYIRKQVYQAKEDGAENLVLDLTANTGGNSYTLEGILALFNKGQGYINTLDVSGGYTVKESHLIDINLDGKWDELDLQEAEKFDFNVGVLTSDVAFSCGNLFPFNMKELGFKIIGEKSGGGSCAVARDTTADGIPYAHSSYLCLTDKKGDNIDGGVEVDFAIEKEQISDYLYNCDVFFNIETISNYLNNAYTK